MTFSIVGLCKESNQIGICTVSASISHGGHCPFLSSTVGAVITQARTNSFHGHHILQLMEKGIPPKDALEASLRCDSNREYRQVGALNWNGEGAAFTGTSTRDWKGHVIGNDFVACGNLVIGKQVVDAIGEAFSRSKNISLAQRLMGAIEAGQLAGGELGGPHSATLLLDTNKRNPMWPVSVDLRIDWAENAITALRQAYQEWVAHVGRLKNEPITKFYPLTTEIGMDGALIY
ncbi:DUF1028 domain-containing protein [Allopusillimonas ginsengisoli]|uniref:DUF1028 domain-containing protein n=1 Tax=Allopusillimonas ginsengisoli TaxID=453575 RepID=UPI0010225BCD|nr:DUF1028 domain-containing protein [Allopusillimonas ginsengisoli]TEA79662.1 DUF1028 domain-containing protein [Allopusillimonas ginsengisoli]